MIVLGVIIAIATIKGIPEQIEKLKGEDTSYAIGSMMATVVFLGAGIALAIGGYKMTKAD
ncbi:hypothetical protein LX66_5385 [Chitinophaga japonensis]|uniref:Uncharacterized protein n=2 Tax=Chitinophaga japonensis TaxID=104662 RepID=A0A562SLL1_CHIJA|nr:hypothetical protein LX66_5385 [Chitinophaga japonensis]